MFDMGVLVFDVVFVAVVDSDGVDSEAYGVESLQLEKATVTPRATVRNSEKKDVCEAVIPWL